MLIGLLTKMASPVLVKPTQSSSGRTAMFNRKRKGNDAYFDR
jgi:hypothetical protein